LVFWRPTGRPKSQLREMTLHFGPEIELIREPIVLDDLHPMWPMPEQRFREFLDGIRYQPAHTVETGEQKQLIFLSGVVATIINSQLHSVRVAQREQRETTPSP